MPFKIADSSRGRNFLSCIYYIIFHPLLRKMPVKTIYCDQILVYFLLKGGRALPKVELCALWKDPLMGFCYVPNGRRANNNPPIWLKLITEPNPRSYLLRREKTADFFIQHAAMCVVLGQLLKSYTAVCRHYFKHNFMHAVHKATSPCMSPIFWRRIRINQYFLLAYNKQLNQTIM